MVDLFDVAVQATVSDTVRVTVGAVSALQLSVQSVSLGAIAKHLQLDKGTVSRRIKVALAEGYVRNLESRKNQPMQLVVRDPLPDAVSLLPDPSRLAPSCSVAVLQQGIDMHPSPRVSEQQDANDAADLF